MSLVKLPGAVTFDNDCSLHMASFASTVVEVSALLPGIPIM